MIELQESVCFVLDIDIPDNEILAVLSAIQQYRREAMERINGWNSMYPRHMRKTLDLTLDIVCSNEKYRRMFADSIDDIHFVTAESVKANIRKYEMVRPVSHLIAYNFGVRSRHASQVYGLLVGTEASSLPDISNWIRQSNPYFDVIFVGNDLEFAQTLAMNIALPEDLISRVAWSNKSERPLLDIAKDVAGCKMIVGDLGFATYVAATQSKAVFELYPEEMSENWLSKWTCPSYGQMKSNGSEINIRGIEMGVARAWAIRSALRQKAEQRAQQMVAIE